MKIAILGYGSQGASAREYWSSPENEITICDANKDLAVPDGYAAQLGENYLANLDRFDLIVRSPSVHPKDITKANPQVDLQNKVTSNTNEFFRVCPTKNVIGVTGTKGKGTTSTLIAKMLEAADKTVHLGGNIGTPPLEMLKNNIQPDDWVVLELANFQLIDLKHSPHIAVCLMVVPEHLDWHADEAEYIEAKQQLFRWQIPDDIAIYYGLNPTSEHVVSVRPGQKIPYMKHPGADVINDKVVIGGHEICHVSQIKLLGQHNWQNVCAAVTTVWQITQDVQAISSVITSFTGLEHRLEFVRELNGVTYYDDSFGTTPETAMVAIQAFENPKVIILGGSDKGADYADLARTVAENNVRKVVLIGEQASRIRVALEAAGFHNFEPGGDTMTEIVTTARNAAQPGDTVLLSTACASFDMFQNYQDRGLRFKNAVEQLA